MILACDIGGTKTNLALLEENHGVLEFVCLATYPSRDHRSLDEILELFLSGGPSRLQSAGFGVAGPVLGGQVHTTNLPWLVDGRSLAKRLGLPTVALMNDVEAHAWSVERLGAADLVSLQEGAVARGTAAVIAAGTGLGFSALIRGPGGAVTLASEGGHADFAPAEEIEVELLRYLQIRFGHVSVERVLSGTGLLSLYSFLRHRDGGDEPAWLAEDMKNRDPTEAVAEAGIEGRCALCGRSVELFLGIYGAEAGNWALRTLATAGLYLGGGIARKLLVGGADVRQGWRSRAREIFLARFLGKGRLRPLLEAMPVRVITNDRAPLIGAAQRAMYA